MAKNIVICSDGTGQDGLGTTNVVRLFTLLDLSDPEKQIACYDPGVGTTPRPEALKAVARTDPGFVSINAASSPAVLRPFKRTAGLAIGAGLFQNVKQMYEVLIDHYKEGDRIYMFGFSRGAFTVRVLAGLLFRLGVLLPKYRSLYAEAFALYEPHFEALSSEELKSLQADIETFKNRYAKPCREIAFLGLWDTVKSVGYLWPKSMPHTRRNPIVNVVRHALSLDEARSFFVPTTWGGIDQDTEAAIQGQDVQEIWFAGVHSDVGGGYEKENLLAKISLRWILNEACKERLQVLEAECDTVFRDQGPQLPSHDELKKIGWWAAERFPRWELENDPPPPRREFRWGPSGRREIAKSARNKKILIDSHAREFCSSEKSPWAGIDPKIQVEFVDTANGRGWARRQT